MKHEHILRRICWFILSAVFTVPTSAADWPQWRGPHRDGIATGESGLIKAWPDGGPPLIWQSEGFGIGYSSVAVVQDAIYTMGDIDDKQFVIAANRKNGEIIWKTAVGPAHQEDFPGARSTPTVDTRHVYTLSTAGVLSCLQTANGKLQWKRDLVKEFGGHLARYPDNNFDWRFSESPLIDGEQVVVTPGAPGALMVAFHKRTGKKIWRTTEKDFGSRGASGAGYSSIVISHARGVKHYVTLTGRGAIGVDAKSGEHLWGYNAVANEIANIPTPLVSGNHVFVSTGYGTGGALLEIVIEDGQLVAEEVHFLRRADNHHGGMILTDDHIFLGKGSNSGLPLCIEMLSGEIKWGPVRNEGKGSAAISMADGHLYLRYQNGLMVLVEADPSGYREKGMFMIPNVEDHSWSHPVIAGRRLYLREQNRLYCYDLAENLL